LDLLPGNVFQVIFYSFGEDSWRNGRSTVNPVVAFIARVMHHAREVKSATAGPAKCAATWRAPYLRR